MMTVFFFLGELFSIVSPNSHLAALPITKGGTAIREQRTLTQWVRKAKDHFIKTPTTQSQIRPNLPFC